LAEAKWKAGQNKARVEELEELEHQKDLVIQQKEKENKLQHVIIYLLVVIGVLLFFALVFFVLYIRKKRVEYYYKQLHQVTGLRMKNTRNRISSHFFFNVLSIISTYEPERMKTMLDKLTLLFRKSVENIDQLAVPLREELELVKAFVDLQKLRLSDQFTFEITVDEGVDLEQMLPAMMIQIPVENAIKHGLMPSTEPQKLSIRMKQNHGYLLIQIADNGVGFGKSAGRTTGTGTGLKVLYEVINLLNAKNENKIITNINGLDAEMTGDNSGTVVSISIPQNYHF